MSWSVYLTTSVDADVGEAIDAAIAEQESLSAENRKNLQAAWEQVLTAKATALVLLTSVTRPGDDVRISLNGHHNPEKTPVPGWSDDVVTVSVSQIPARVLDAV